MRKIILIILVILTSCNQKTEEEKIEDSIRLNINNFYFEKNKNVEIIELKINKITDTTTNYALGRCIKNRLLYLAQQESGLTLEAFFNDLQSNSHYIEEAQNKIEYHKYSEYLKKFKDCPNVYEVFVDFKITTQNLDGSDISNKLEKNATYYVAQMGNEVPYEVVSPY